MLVSLERIGKAQLFFRLECTSEGEAEFVLHSSSAQVAAKKVRYQPGYNWFTLTIPPLFVTDAREHYCLDMGRLKPLRLWQGDVQLVKTQYLAGAKACAVYQNPASYTASVGEQARPTILMIDHQTPTPDKDAGSYAAINEIKLIQSLGFNVKFLPLDLAFSLKYTRSMQAMGVQVCYQPFYTSVNHAVLDGLENIAGVYITRFHVAQQVLPLIRKAMPGLPVIFNNADLHFLRELRGLLSSGAGTMQSVMYAKTAELEVMRQVDAILSYSDAEHAVIASHIHEQEKIFKCPWVLQIKAEVTPFEQRNGIAFLAGFRHLPNVEALIFFAEQVMPLLTENQPNLKLYIYGSHMPEQIAALRSKNIEPVGYVESLDEVYANHRVFVAPLISGAGVKGKVLESMAYGLPTVLSPVAAEGTGLTHGISTMVAKNPSQWADFISELYHNKSLWNRLSGNSQILAAEHYSFEHGQEQMRAVFNFVGIDYK
ncbi:glycosyltransferase [Reinekea marinisedimentorum]|uniref:Glycosyl transferase family 1 n=1 Tax=Reinekea marinisedimentorum TaxID=230495 RepID=A0A4R3I711_9GAMM|nr:glycosyltransferase family 4 protein [Reinekea marinisedimentorum]TCS41935.1 glycosyl transferase family 1 [Reinekea marinisedimentorum]